MKVTLKNDTLLIEYESRYDIESIKKKIEAIGLVLPEEAQGVDSDPLTGGLPVLLGRVREIGPGPLVKINSKGERIKFPISNLGVNVNDRVLFQVSNQIAFKKEGKTFYVVGAGNILASVEE